MSSKTLAFGASCAEENTDAPSSLRVAANSSQILLAGELGYAMVGYVTICATRDVSICP